MGAIKISVINNWFNYQTLVRINT